MTEEQQRAALSLQTQQQVIFDSMVEGLLLLDERGCVQLANRALILLFGLTADIRGRTIMEALRLHELADLVRSLDTQKQVLGFEMKLPGQRRRHLQRPGSPPGHRPGLPRLNPPQAARKRPAGVRRQRQP
jgi:PAS domain-containing protein